ncbi:MAG TPA: beta-ketoacyl synthase N-terminal-like domain-containing protein, partial [Chloroflexota bacterium]|nr:beta-ketoacyl synthase N-terminal-like domain-containing protein [Chloroflexota bacterium]
MTVIPVLPAGPGAGDPVALVGLACLFPDASTPDAFWRNLLDGRDSTSLLTAAELGVDPSLIYDPRQGVLDKSYWMRGGFVRDFRLDPEGFRLSADAIEQLDEVTQWTLHVVRGALRDAVLRAGTHDGAVPANGAGEIDGALRRCGLVLGNLSFPTRSSQRAYGPLYVGSVERALGELLDRPDLRLPGPAVLGEAAVSGALVAGSPAGLAARALGLGGPTFCLDAACASSLYAIALACEYLRAGKADLMLAGAVSCADPMFVNMGFSIFRAFPADGAESRPLDRRSGGLVAGEGAGIVALKRHADAVRDGDRIYALVRGAGLSNDGRGKHVLQPSSRGQVLALERAYAASGVDPRDVQYVECHATGTPAGDVVELNTIERFFGARGHIPLTGTVKSNFGHLLTAAGVAGTIKTALAMEAGQIPATIRVDEPLASEEGAVNGAHLVRAAVAWPATGKPRMAGVSAFGFGGTNAHVVLEAPGTSPSDQPAPAPENVAPAAVPPVPAAQPALAITGMEVHTAGCEDLAAFEQAVYDGRQLLGPLPEQRWRGITQHELWNGADAPPGAYLRGFDLDFLQYRIPPNPSDQPIAQQLLLLSVADAAIRDAALREGAAVAVVVAMETELELHRYRGRVELDWQVRAALHEAGIWLSEDEETALAGLAKQSVLNPAQVNQYASFIGNIMATRVASQWDFSGPAFTVSESENASFRALEVAQLLLAGGTVEAVVVAGVELAGSVESVTLRDRAHPAGRTLGLQIGLADGGEAGWLPGDGAAAVVVRLARDAARNQERIYATVEAVSLIRSDGAPRAGASPVTPAAVTGAARKALEMAGV